MADLIAIRVMPVNLTNSLAVPRPPPPPPPPPSEHMKRSASRNLFGAPKHGEIDALVEREQKLHCDHILERYNIDIKALDEHDRIMAAAAALQKQQKQQRQQQQQQQHSGNMGDNQHQQHYHHHHHQLNKCNSLKNNNSNNNNKQISSSASTTSLSPLKLGGIVSSLYAAPSTFLSLAMEREQRSKPYARQRTIKDYSFPVRKMQRRQETTPPNVPRCLAAASGSSVNGANKSQAIKISSVTKDMTPPTSPSLLSSSPSSLSSSSPSQTLSNKTDSTKTTSTKKNNNNQDDKSNNNTAVNIVVAEDSQTSQSSSSTTTTTTTPETPSPPPTTAKCNETS